MQYSGGETSVLHRFAKCRMEDGDAGLHAILTLDTKHCLESQGPLTMGYFQPIMVYFGYSCLLF